MKKTLNNPQKVTIPSRDFQRCIEPTLGMLQNMDTLQQVLHTHEWTVQDARNYGEGFITRVTCKNCGLGRVSILYQDRKSMRKDENHMADSLSIASHH